MTIRRSTGAGTVPAGVTQAGDVTTNAVKDTVLDYSGTEAQLKAIFTDTETGLQGTAWIYVPSATPPLARVVAVEQTHLLLDRSMTGASSAAFDKVSGTLINYSILNDGGATGTVNGVNLLNGESLIQTVQYPVEADCLEAVYIDASGTDFLITENE